MEWISLRLTYWFSFRYIAVPKNEDRAEIDPAYFRIILYYFINQIGALPTHSLLQPMKQS